MTWIAIGLVAGSLVVSQHPSKEACEGRAAILTKDNKIEAKCFEFTPSRSITYGTESDRGLQLFSDRPQ